MLDLILYSILGLCIGLIVFIIFGSIIFVFMVLDNKGGWIDEVHFATKDTEE